MKEIIKDGFLCRTVLVENKLGLHARAAAKIVKLVAELGLEVYIEKGDSRVSAKSIIGILTLAVECGTEVEIQAKGDNAKGALDGVASLFGDKFGEES